MWWKFYEMPWNEVRLGLWYCLQEHELCGEDRQTEEEFLIIWTLQKVSTLEAEHLKDTLRSHYADWARKASQPLKALANKPDDLSLILGLLMVEGENPLWQLYL